MSLRQGRKATLPVEPDPEPEVDAVASPGDDEIEILEVTGVNETERTTEPLHTIDPEPPAAPPSEDQVALEHALADVQRERDQKHDQWMRSQADLDNLKKRAEREAVERRLTDAMNLFRRLLPVIDNLERALDAAADRDDPLRSGVVLIHQQLVEAMGREGLAPIQSIGAPFDPARHEAVEMVAAAGRQPGTILEEMQRGYLLKDRLVRPALVRVVAGAPAGEGSGGATGDKAP